MAIRVRINFLHNLQQSSEEVITYICSLVSITIRDIHHTREYIVLHLDETDTEKLLAPDIYDKLLQRRLKVLTPKGFTSGKTVFVTKLTDYFTSHDPQTIIDEINKCNSNITASSVFVISGKQSNSYYKTLKLVLASTNHADFIVKNGLKLFNVNINPSNVHKEDPINIIQCYKCLKFGHYTSSCKVIVNTCSICSGSHHYKECNNKSHISCANCKGTHIAVASVCPERKGYIQQLLAQQRSAKGAGQSRPQGDNAQQSSAKGAAHSEPQRDNNNGPLNNFLNFPPPPLPRTYHHTQSNILPVNTNTNVDNDTSGHLIVIIEYAKIRAKGNHDTFLSIMNQYFTHNNKPSLNMPNFVLDNNVNINEMNTHTHDNVLKDAATSPHTEILAPIPFSQVVESHQTNKIDASTSPNWPEAMVKDHMPFDLNSQPPPSLSISPMPKNSEDESLHLHLTPSKKDITQETSISTYNTPLSSSVSLLNRGKSFKKNPKQINFSKSEEGNSHSNNNSKIIINSDANLDIGSSSPPSYPSSSTSNSIKADFNLGLNIPSITVSETPNNDSAKDESQLETNSEKSDSESEADIEVVTDDKDNRITIPMATTSEDNEEADTNSEAEDEVDYSGSETDADSSIETKKKINAKYKNNRSPYEFRHSK